MKSRKVIVATLMASASCAWAQSNVTVYGSVDAAVGAVKQSSGTASPGGGAVSAGRSSTQLDSGVGPGSRLGFRGTEDLGGGLKALFALEAGIGVDTGSFQQGGLAFGRQAYVGLGGTNWSVTAGRQYAPMDPAFAMSDALGGSYWGNVLVNSGHIIYGGLGAVTGGGAYQTPSRVDNSILASSTFGPISASIMIAAGNEDDKKSGRLASLGLTYMAGPLQINGVYTRLYQNAEAILPTAKPELLTEYLLGGSYDFGVAKLFAGYYGFEGPKNSANLSISARANPFAFSWRKTDTYWVGARVPIGAGAVIAQVARTGYDYASGSDGRATLLGFAYEYYLSKRSVLYASVGQVNNNAFANGYLGGATSLVLPNGYGSTTRVVSLGLRHSF